MIDKLRSRQVIVQQEKHEEGQQPQPRLQQGTEFKAGAVQQARDYATQAEQQEKGRPYHKVQDVFLSVFFP